MKDLFELEPKDVIKFFYDINQIPRGSGNEKEISDFLLKFGKDRGLYSIQDEYLNVLIRKPATSGYEDKQGIIIQGHMDMVCEKNEDTVHDFIKDPIKMLIEGDHLTADGTTLGADNGIAVAMGLAVLDSNTLSHPEIELLITTDEEVGMTGAINFDTNLLKGKYFLNLDSEEEGEFVVSCAGGLKSIISLPVHKKELLMEGHLCKEVALKKLIGGHSGVEINKCRANAIKLTGRLLCQLDEKIDIHLVDIFGGTKDNVIPRETFFTVVIPENEEELFNEILDSLGAEISNEYRVSDPDIEIVSDTLETGTTLNVIEEQDMETAIFLLVGLPNGVQSMSAELEGFVESSLNIGKIALEDDHLVYLFSIRSGVRSLKYHITNTLELFARQTNSEFIKTAEYPEWPIKKDSLLLEKSMAIYKETTGKEPLVKSLHAGVEPGVFLESRPDIEAISIGPDMQAVHSPDEWVSISSLERTYKFICELLAAL